MSQNHLLTFVKSITLIVTKCPTNVKSDDYDYEVIQSDIYETLYEHFNVENDQKESTENS